MVSELAPLSLTQILRRRPQWVLAAILAMTSIGIVLQPGFGRLNYYFALSTALVVPLLVGFAVIQAVGQLGRAAASSPPLWALFRVSGALTAVYLTIPLLAAGLAAIWVRNCAPFRGVLFYLFETGLGTLVASVVALGVALLPIRWRSALFLAIWLASLLATTSDLYFEPRIFLYNHFVGFFSGAIYDEVIVITATFVWFRLVSLALVFVVASLVILAFDPTSGTLSRRAFRQRRAVGKLAWCGLAVVVCTAQLAGGYIGFSRGRRDVQRELSHHRTSEHFVFHVADALDAERWKQLVDDFEFRYDRLSRFFAVDLDRRVHVYIYAGAAQKRRLMGAARTFVAKPWLFEVHLNRVKFGDAIVTHELAHVFAAAFGSGPFRIAARYGVLVNMGLVEGVAVAAEWDDGDYTPHQLVAAMRTLARRNELSRLPALASIMGTFGFWKQHAGTAYTIAGSFVRFLVERYGVAAIKRVYGGEAFRAAYGKSFADLTSEWERFLENPRLVPVDAVLLRLAAYRFNRRGVLYRVCGNEIARLEKLRAEAEKQHRFAFALEVQQRIDRYVSDHPNKRYRELDLLIKLGRYGEARRVAASLRADKRSSELLRLYVGLRLGDIDWLLDRRPEALKRYAAVLEAKPRRSTARATWVKVRALQQPQIGQRLRQWFLNPRLEGRISDELLLDLFEDHRSQPLVRYLLARRLLERRRYAAASRLLQTLTIESLPSDDFGFEAYRVWGEALYFLGRYGEAERLFERLAQQYASQPEGVRRQVDEWRARCRWRQLHRTRAGLFFFGPGLFHWLRQVRAS